MDKEIFTTLQTIFDDKNLFIELLTRYNKMNFDVKEYIQEIIKNDKKFSIFNSNTLVQLMLFCNKQNYNIYDTFFKDKTEEDLIPLFQKINYNHINHIIFVSKFLNEPDYYNFLNSCNMSLSNFVNFSIEKDKNSLLKLLNFITKYSESKNVYINLIINFDRANSKEIKDQIFNIIIDWLNHLSKSNMKKLINFLYTKKYIFPDLCLHFLNDNYKLLKTDLQIVIKENKWGFINEY